MAAALLLVDVINGFDFEGSDELARAAESAAPRIAQLIRSARKAGAPVVYVNDNFGLWQSDWSALARSCMGAKMPGRGVTKKLLPTKQDYFVLKPRHSGFLGTPLEHLLEHLGVGSLVIAGFATDLCVLCTALDAHARGFHVVVPQDCTAASTEHAARTALEVIGSSLGATTCVGAKVPWPKLARSKRRKLF